MEQKVNEDTREVLLILQEECAEVTQAVSKCFRFGPITSSVVALTTALPNAEPATVCLAAFNLSTML